MMFVVIENQIQQIQVRFPTLLISNPEITNNNRIRIHARHDYSFSQSTQETNTCVIQYVIQSDETKI